MGQFAGRARKSHLDCCFFVTRGEDDVVVVAAASVPGCRKFSKIKFLWSRLLSFVERKGKARQEARLRFPRLPQARGRHASKARKVGGFTTIRLRLICSAPFRKLLTVSCNMGVGDTVKPTRTSSYLSVFLSLNNYLSKTSRRFKNARQARPLSIT